MIAGTPAALCRGLLAPVAGNDPVRATFKALAHPVPATVIFIVSRYFWEIPRYHNPALLKEPVHYTMHVTMPLAGLVFWWRLFQFRLPGAYGVEGERVEDPDKFGAVFVTTKDPGDTFGGTARFGYGSEKLRDGFVAVDLPVSDTLESRFSFGSRVRDG